MKRVAAVMVKRKEIVAPGSCAILMESAKKKGLPEVFAWITFIPFKITYMYIYKIKLYELRSPDSNIVNEIFLFKN